MRHKVTGRKLGRDINARKALLRNLSSSTLQAGYVVTTEAKAKFVRGFLEKLIRSVQKNSLSANRVAASVVTGSALLRLVNEVAPGMEGRNGGYTRIIKLNARRGDNAPMAKLELVEWDKSKAKTQVKKPAVLKKPVKKLNENKK